MVDVGRVSGSITLGCCIPPPPCDRFFCQIDRPSLYDRSVHERCKIPLTCCLERCTSRNARLKCLITARFPAPAAVSALTTPSHSQFLWRIPVASSRPHPDPYRATRPPQLNASMIPTFSWRMANTNGVTSSFECSSPSSVPPSGDQSAASSAFTMNTFPSRVASINFNPYLCSHGMLGDDAFGRLFIPSVDADRMHRPIHAGEQDAVEL